MTYIELISLIPINTLVIMQSLDSVPHVRASLGKVIHWFPLFSMYMVSLNSCSNFFIYILTNNHFRKFSKNLFTCNFSTVNVTDAASSGTE